MKKVYYNEQDDPRQHLRTRYDMRRDCFITSHTRFNFFTTTGGSRTESEKHFMDKLEAWFAVMEEAGKPIDHTATYEAPPPIMGRPKRERVRLHLSVTPEFKGLLEEQARELHASISDVMEHALSHYLGQEARKEFWMYREEQDPH